MAQAVAEKITVGIVGHMCAAKTEAGRSMARATDALFVDELNPKLHPLFEKFYNFIKLGVKPNPVALEFEKRFLDEAISQAAEIAITDTDLVFWVMPPVGHFMYAHLLHEQGFLTDEEFDEYCQYFVDRVTQAFSPTVLLVLINEDEEMVERWATQRALDNPERAGELETIKSNIEYINTQKEYWKRLFGTDVNYPLQLLVELMPHISMILVLSNEYDLRSEVDAKKVYEEKLQPKYGILNVS